MEYDTQKMITKMLRIYYDFRDKIVLEVGCGSGDISSSLAKDTQQFIGIDPDAAVIHDAQKKYKHVNFGIGRGESLAFADNRLDLVLFTLSLHHQDSAQALKEADRVLKSNGNLLVVEPSVKGEFQQFFHLFDDETDKIQSAYENLKKSAFILELEDAFNARAMFEDKADLCAYSFDRNRILPGDADRIIKKLDEMQPGSADHSPIRINDTLNIYWLTKA